MPSPFLGGRIVTSKTNVDRPVAIEPVPEHYAGDNNPYRGIENHGVASDSPWRETDEDMPDHDGRLVTVFDQDNEEPDPIPVRIVNRSSVERRAFRVIISYAGGMNTGRAIQILGQDDSRTAATIINRNAVGTVFIADAPETANDVSGWAIVENGGSYRTESQKAIYATFTGADDGKVRIAVEYRVSLDD